MDPLLSVFAGLVGYFVGALSFARLVTRRFAPEQDISKIQVSTPDGEAKMESDAVSATTVRLHVGRQYGCLVSILDMAKAAVPALAFKLWLPDTPYYLIAAATSVIGHNWPVYYRFKGGRGLSPTLGGMLVLDWLGVLITNIAAFLVGYPIRNILVVTGGGIVIMIPWIWIRTHDLAQLLYVLTVNILYWGAMIPELREYARLRREGRLKDFVAAQQIYVRGRVAGESVNWLTMNNMFDRLKSYLRRENARE